MAKYRNNVLSQKKCQSLPRYPTSICYINFKYCYRFCEIRWPKGKATKNAYRILVGKPEGKRPLRRPRRRWVDNVKMDLGEI
jgi:hypothetical protein